MYIKIICDEYPIIDKQILPLTDFIFFYKLRKYIRKERKKYLNELNDEKKKNLETKLSILDKLIDK